MLNPANDLYVFKKSNWRKQPHKRSSILTRVTSPKGTKNHIFFEYLAASVAKYCLKPGGEKAGIGLRRESVRFPESKKLKP